MTAPAVPPTGPGGGRAKALLALLFAAAVALVLLATGKGPGISPDSCNYLSMAQNFAAGRGIETSILPWKSPGDSAPLFYWPPLFPAALASIRALGPSLDEAARILEAASFGAVVVLTALLAGLLESGAARAEGRAPRPAVAPAAGMLALLSVPLLDPATWIWSDAPFHAFSLLAILLFLRSGDEAAPPGARGRFLAASSAACALALLTRNAGVTLWIVLLLGCCGLGGAAPRLPRARAVATMACAVLPWIAWLLRNRIRTGAFLWGERPTDVSRWIPMARDTVAGALSDWLPVPFLGSRTPEILGFPWKWTAALLVAGAAAFLFLRGQVPASALRRLRRDSGPRFLLRAWGLTLLGVYVPQAWIHGDIEQRYLATAYPLLLAAGTAALLPSLGAAGGAGRTSGLRIAVALWVAYSLLACTATVCFARTRGGWSSAEFLGSPVAECLRNLDAPRFATDFDVGVWYMTRRPVRLLPEAKRPGAVRDLVEGRFDGAIVAYKGPHRWSPAPATIDELIAAGLLLRWERVGEFPECDVFVRRR